MSQIDDSILSAPLARFDLSVRSRNALNRVAVNDVRSLLCLMQAPDGLAGVYGLGAESITELEAFVASLRPGSISFPMPPVDTDDEALVDLNLADLGLPDAPIFEQAPPSGPLDLVGMLPHLVDKILKPAERESIGMRFGLGFPKRYSLTEIGIVRGITRERVRQIVDKGVKQLRRYLEGEVPRPRSVPPASPDLVKEASTVRELLAQAAPTLASERALQDILDERYGSAGDRSAFRLLLETFGYDFVSWRLRGLRPAWSASSGPHDHLEVLVRMVRAILSEATVPVSLIDLKIAVQRQIRNRVVSTDELKLALEMDADVEPVDAGWQMCFARLPKQGDKAYRILHEAGHPLDYHDLLRRLNQRLVHAGEEPVGARSVTNQMSNDPRIAPTGKSGQWGLVEWGIQVDTIASEIQRFLHGRGEPTAVGEIVEHLLRVRPDVAKSSILVYLSGREEFCRVGDALYALTAWGMQPVEVAARTSSEEVRSKMLAALAELFDGVEDLPHAVLIRRIRERTGLAEATVTLALTRLPCVEILPDPAYEVRKRVHYHPSRVCEAHPTPSTPTIEQVWAMSVAFFEKHGNNRVKLADLVAHLQKFLSLKKPTLYAYLSRMPGLTKEQAEGVTWCTLARPRDAGDA